MKGAYRGQLLAAVGIDGNNYKYLIAWAVVGVERKEGYLEVVLGFSMGDDIGCFLPTYIYLESSEKKLISFIEL